MSIPELRNDSDNNRSLEIDYISRYDKRIGEGSGFSFSFSNLNSDIKVGPLQLSYWPKDRCHHPLGPIPYIGEYRRYSSIAFEPDLFEKRFLIKIRIPENYELSCHLSRLIIALYCWISRDKDREKSARDIVFKTFSEGPKFAKYLKDYRHFSIRKTLYGIGLDPIPEAYIDVTRANTYSDIFSERYLIHWIESDPRDFFRYSFIPVNEISDDDKELFLSKLLEILPDNIEVSEYASRLSVLLTPSLTESVRIEKGVVTDKGPLSILRSKYPDSDRISKEFIGIRSVIQVGPANTRDAVILDHRSLLAVQTANKMLTNIVERLDSSAHIRDPVRRYRKIDKFLQSNQFFFMRDIKKEGLTKPRELISLVQRGLSLKYPKISWDILDVYKSVRIIDSDEIYSPDRGTSLGMCNELTTIIQCTIFEILKDEFQEINDGITPSAIFLNDDGVIGFDSNDDSIAIDIADIERSIFDRFSLIRNEEKSYFSNYGMIFLEEYFLRHVRDEKFLLRDCNTMMSILCQNATHAKSFLQSSDSEVLEKWLSIIISVHGYEFDEREIYYPIDLGGWIPQKRYGLSTSLEYIFDNDVDLKLCERLYLANQTKYIPRKKGERYLPYFLRDRDELQELFPCDSDLFNRRRIRERKGFSEFWDKSYKMRINSFYKSKLDNFLTKEDLVKKIIKLTDCRLFSLPDQLVKKTTLEMHSIHNPDLVIDSSLSGYLMYLFRQGIIKFPIGRRIALSDFNYQEWISSLKMNSCLEVAGRRLTTFKALHRYDITPRIRAFDLMIVNSTSDIDRFTIHPQLVLADFAFRNDLVPSQIDLPSGIEPYLFRMKDKTLSMRDAYIGSTFGLSVNQFLYIKNLMNENNSLKCLDILVDYLLENPPERSPEESQKSSSSSEQYSDNEERDTPSSSEKSYSGESIHFDSDESEAESEDYEIGSDTDHCPETQGTYFYTFLQYIELRYGGHDDENDSYITPQFERLCNSIRTICRSGSSFVVSDADQLERIKNEMLSLEPSMITGFLDWWEKNNPKSLYIEEDDMGDSMSAFFS